MSEPILPTEKRQEMTGPKDRLGAATSVAAHLAVLFGIFMLAGARPFETSTAEAIKVDLVPAAELPQREPAPAADPAVKQDDPSSSLASAPPPAPPQKLPAEQVASAQSASARAQAQPKPPTPFAESQPDITERFGVMLGLPEVKPTDDLGGGTSLPADINANFATIFRERVKTCSTLPGSIAKTDNVKIKLRVAFTTDGKLAARPSVIEASASAKGPLLMQASIDALLACQPYTMLPPDKYKEWRVLDLNFTPQDFKGG